VKRTSLICSTAFLLLIGKVHPVKAGDFDDRLRAANADSDFETWVDQNQIQSPADAWEKLPRPDCMLWLVGPGGLTVMLDKAKLRLFVCDIAEHVLPVFEREHPNDKRPRLALEVARLYVNGRTTKKKLETAAAAAFQAGYDASNPPGTYNGDYDAAASFYNSEAALFPAYAAYPAFIANTQNYDAPSYSGLHPYAINSAAFAANSAFDAATPYPSDDVAYTAARVAVANACAANASAAYDKVSAADGHPDAAKAYSEAAISTEAWQTNRLRFYFPNPFKPKPAELNTK